MPRKTSVPKTKPAAFSGEVGGVEADIGSRPQVKEPTGEAALLAQQRDATSLHQALQRLEQLRPQPSTLTRLESLRPIDPKITIRQALESASNKIENIGHAALAVLDSVDIFFRGRNMNEKVFAGLIASLDYVSRTQQGHELSANQEEIARIWLSLGIVMNEYYDEGLAPEKMRELNTLQEQLWKEAGARKTDGLAERIEREKNLSQTLRFYRRVMEHLEKNNRPVLAVLSPEERFPVIAEYREKVNLVSLATLCAATYNQPLENFIDMRTLSLTDRTPGWFTGLFWGIMALQVLDDRVGWRGDYLHQRPSYFTALTPEQELPSEAVLDQRFVAMDQLYDDYLTRAFQADPDFMLPIFLVSSQAPEVVEFIGNKPKIKDFMYRHFGTERDRQDYLDVEAQRAQKESAPH